MPTKKMNPVEEHFEKGILGIAVIVLLYILIAYTLTSPSIELGTRPVRPGQAYGYLKEQAEELDRKARQQESQWPDIAVAQETSNDNARKTKELPKNFTSELIPVVLPNVEERASGPSYDSRVKYEVPKVLAPSKVTLSSGRSTINLANEADLKDFFQTSEDYYDVSWVTVVGEIDLEKQRKLMEELPDKVEREPMFVRVDLQRAEVGADGKTGKWEDVANIDGANLLLAPEEPLKLKSMDDLRTVRNALFTNLGDEEATALNPICPTVVYGDEWDIPMLPGEKKAAEAESQKQAREERQAKKTQAVVRTPQVSRRTGGGGGGMMGGMGGPGGGGGGGRMRGMGAARGGRAMGGGAMPGMMGPGAVGPGVMPGMMGPGAAGPGVMPGLMGPGGGVPGMQDRLPQQTIAATKLTDEQRREQKTLKVWANDFTAKPGKTYKYRMRVIMYNPLAGYKPYLMNPDNNLLAGLASEWVEAAGSVSISKPIYYFVEGQSSDKNAARFSVYKWYMGKWYKADFNVKIGETIGAKRKVVLLTSSMSDTNRSTTERERGEVDFSTDATLEKIDPNADGTSIKVTITTAEGQTEIQDSATISETKEYKDCRDTLKKQYAEEKKLKRAQTQQ
jgi:hypothetical protein